MRRSGVRIPYAPPHHKARTCAILDGFGSGLVAVLGSGDRAQAHAPSGRDRSDRTVVDRAG